MAAGARKLSSSACPFYSRISADIGPVRTLPANDVSADTLWTVSIKSGAFILRWVLAPDYEAMTAQGEALFSE
jgi:hypothetical protein